MSGLDIPKPNISGIPNDSVDAPLRALAGLLLLCAAFGCIGVKRLGRPISPAKIGCERETCCLGATFRGARAWYLLPILTYRVAVCCVAVLDFGIAKRLGSPKSKPNCEPIADSVAESPLLTRVRYGTAALRARRSRIASCLLASLIARYFSTQAL